MTPLIAETADAGRMAMHIGLVAIVIAIAVVALVASRHRKAEPPTERLDSTVGTSDPETPA